jgi:hypothetical protein
MRLLLSEALWDNPNRNTKEHWCLEAEVNSSSSEKCSLGIFFTDLEIEKHAQSAF